MKTAVATGQQVNRPTAVVTRLRLRTENGIRIRGSPYSCARARGMAAVDGEHKERASTLWENMGKSRGVTEMVFVPRR
jgi:hypothetical protein